MPCDINQAFFVEQKQIRTSSQLDLVNILLPFHMHLMVNANRTRSANQRIAFQCVGTKSSRDAIGATVDVVAGDQKRRVWLLSGDGYMSSNERILKLGVGSTKTVTDVVVRWPSNEVESFGTLQTGATYLLVEGTGQAFQQH